MMKLVLTVTEASFIKVTFNCRPVDDAPQKKKKKSSNKKWVRYDDDKAKYIYRPNCV